MEQVKYNDRLPLELAKKYLIMFAIISSHREISVLFVGGMKYMDSSDSTRKVFSKSN